MAWQDQITLLNLESNGFRDLDTDLNHDENWL